MKNMRTIVRFGILLGLFSLSTACVVAEPREGYYDHGHARYYHEHSWHECGHDDHYCR
ncbi:MAG TPA: hypothetical protein VHZ99_02705 [Steroidobacteraceae bacterium]|nr:hypothetical protein [Steroidobacteraceae bacterium]